MIVPTGHVTTLVVYPTMMNNSVLYSISVYHIGYNGKVQTVHSLVKKTTNVKYKWLEQLYRVSKQIILLYTTEQTVQIKNPLSVQERKATYSQGMVWHN